jgi:hypothetical protein
MVAEAGNGRPWPPLEELHSDEAKLIRLALDSLGEQQLEMLGSIEGVSQKVGNNTQQIKDSEQQIRAEQRAEFKLVRQQFAAINKTLEIFGEKLGEMHAFASQARDRVDSLGKVLGKLSVSDRFVSSDSIPPPVAPSIPPPLTLGDKTDWKRTPMGGIKLDQKDQAVLAQRMAKLEEERRIADAVAAERASIIATQKREAEEQRLAAERKEEQSKKDKRDQDALDIQKSAERRARLTAYVAAGVTLGGMIGGAIVWLVQVLTHH